MLTYAKVCSAFATLLCTKIAQSSPILALGYEAEEETEFLIVNFEKANG